LLVFISDITERKLAEEKILESEFRYRELFETSRDGIAETDLSGRYLECNRAYLDLLGYDTMDQLRLRSYEEVTPHEYHAFEAEVITRQTLTRGWCDEYEKEYIRKTGKRVAISLRAWLRRNVKGQPSGMWVIVRDITERKLAEEQIRRSLVEKQVMLKEIHHRVKNNMQVIISLLNLQADTIADSTVRTLFEESRNRVSAMALIHEKLYQTEDLARIDFKEYLKILAQGIADTYQRHDVHLSVDMEHITLNVNTGIPCGLIVNELITNSFKHAFPKGRKGLIRVGMNKNSEGNYVLIVEDNGIGFEAEQDFRKTSSLGLRLVGVLTGQIRGTIALSRSDGTRFCITFPATT
jgi:PAS domain S-box-containing protein